MTEYDITQLLARKHSDDVFVAQCKTGSSQRKVSIFDAWVMKKSWVRPMVTGYEIKCSRSDFLGDEKWPNYLPFCNQLYFVCPAGMIRLDELPAEVGLIWVSKTGTRLYTKKKSPRRDVQIPDTIYRYILMWRTQIGIDQSQGSCTTRATKKQYWEKWLQEKELDRAFGSEVSRVIRETVQQKITKVQRANKDLQQQNATYEKVKEVLLELGFDKGIPNEHQLRHKIAAIRQVISPELIQQFEQLQRQLERTRKQIDKVNTDD